MGRFREVLDRGAKRRIRRRFGSLMRPDEEIVDYDMATLLSDQTRERIDFVATDRALYIFRSRLRHKQRFAYQQMDQVVWDPGSPGLSNRFFVKLLANSGFDVTMKRPPTGLAAYVEQRVSEVDRPVLLERRLPLEDDGRGVTFSYQLISDTDDYAWRMKPDPDLKVTEERNQRIQDFVRELQPEAEAAYEKAQQLGRGKLI
jgi:hypothetical protein